MQFHVRLGFPKIRKRIWNDPVPGYALDETDSQSACLTGSDALRTCGCVIDLLK